jgi:ABC-2 type transport system ATP-binding protein
MLVAQGLHKRYGRIAALDGFDLRIEPGEIVGLIGHNGAGKTTFIGVVAGLIRSDSGRVLVNGIDIGRQPVKARGHIGFAPQEIGLYLSLSLRQNMRLFGSLVGLRGRDLHSATAETSEALGLTALLDRPIGLLSGGQRRRAQAATALMHRPKLLLLDEPTVGADPTTRRALLAAVRRYADDGAAVCYTTHYLPELVELGATVAVADGGRVVARGTTDELLTDVPSELRATASENGRQR